MENKNQKKRVGVLTILDVANFGSMLQGYALASVVQRLGYDVFFVNYFRESYTTGHKVRTFLADKSLGNIIKRVAFAASALLFYSFLRRRIRRFVTGRFRFTRVYHNIAQLRNHPPEADLFVCGSDQIWNSQYNDGIDRSFFLDFTAAPRIAYAASVGMDSFPPEELDEITSLLKKFTALSVRERQTCQYLRDLGFGPCQHVLDPSLLLDGEEWKRIARLTSTPREKYLLVYSVERFNNRFIFEQARTIARAKGLRMYVVCSTYPVQAKDFDFDKIYAMADVKTFLRLMAGAEFIVASSFHGTAFALNFNKDFITIAPDHYNIRMRSLVELFGVSHRVITTHIIDPKTLQPIDYDRVNNILNQERKKSLDFLQKALRE